jgi:putative ABC transport system permease protein
MSEQEMDRRRSRSERLYAVLLRAFPRDFRDEAGLGMAEAFRDQCRAARLRRGAAIALAVLWLRTVIDVARNAAAERLAALRENAGARPMRQPKKGGGTLVETLGRDLRFALRACRQRPGFTLVIILTLALGLGANTAIFSVVKAVLLAPLPYPEPDRLAFVWGRSASGSEEGVSFPDFLELRENNRTFSGLALLRSQSVNLTGGDSPERVTGTFTTASLFETVLAAKAASGRTFTADETEAGSPAPVAVISHGLWQRRFGADPATVGRTLTLNGIIFKVIGVLPRHFELMLVGGLWSTDVFLPLPYYPNRGGLTRDDRSLYALGRLSPGTSVEKADADLGVVMRRLASELPATNASLGVHVVPLREVVVGDARPSLLVLQGAVGLVLLIACANVANLLLARATDRRREIALRAALGADRGRLLRQLLTESVLLAVLGGALGTALGLWGVKSLVAFAPEGLPVSTPIAVDRSVLVLSALLSLVTGVILGLVPALSALRGDLGASLKEGGRNVTGGGRRLREMLVVSEMALSLVMLIGAGLLVQSLRKMQTLDPGFRQDHVLTLSFRLPPTRYAEGEPVAAFFREAIAGIRAVPGVESAALVRAVPLSGNYGTTGYEVEGRGESTPGKEPQAASNIVTPDYFATLGIPIRQGRDFTDHDDASSPLVAIVNETMAGLEWPGQEAVGRRLRLQGTKGWSTVVGVVGDVKHRRLSEPHQAQVYTAHYQDPKIFACVVARTSSDPKAFAESIRKAIWAVDKDQPVWSVLPLDAVLARTFAPTRFLLLLLGAFAVLALVLASVGIYGVLSYAVAQRRPEIGIRMALGARAFQVVRLVVGQGMTLVLAALVLGLGMAFFLSRLLRTMLFGVGPGDPPTFAACAVLLGAVAFCACWLPARRASRVDPASTLGHE